MSFESRFSTSDWEQVKLLPFLLFNFVAFADGKVDDKEIEKLLSELKSAPFFKNLLHRELFMSIVGSDIPALQKRSLEFEQLLDRLKKAKSILQGTLDKQEYQEFMGSMVIFTIDIAKASGGGLFGKKKVSDEEQKAIVALATLFEVDLEVAMQPYAKST